MLVGQFAKEIRVSVESLLIQLRAAGVNVSTASDLIGDADKQRLLDYLRSKHKAMTGLGYTGVSYRKHTARRVLLVRAMPARDSRTVAELMVAMAETDALSIHYNTLSTDELQQLWNGGVNELEDPDRSLVRIALRKKLHIP